MIVKDEVATINVTLGSLVEDIDAWTIVDTGSTDGTQVQMHGPTFACRMLKILQTSR